MDLCHLTHSSPHAELSVPAIAISSNENPYTHVTLEHMPVPESMTQCPHAEPRGPSQPPHHTHQIPRRRRDRHKVRMPAAGRTEVIVCRE
jgi:hypothetical protein